MARADDTSSQHFDWLVASRSRNQQCTAALYGIIEDHADLLRDEVALQLLAQDLAAIAFSLWRAVFLSDLDGDLGGHFADLRHFLRSLIAHNAVLYQTDYNAREWAFTYYLQNAVSRLQQIALSSQPSILNSSDVARAAQSAKEDWANAQDALEIAVANFDRVMTDHGPRSI